MNDTIKGIIIVVVITSMLVLGAATMIPIMQNSFASKKHDFKGADPDTNTNTNTNSADSSSSSDATADNTNNINNTATASNSQEQSACAVAVICQEGSTTVTPPPPTSTTGTLVISKLCDPDCPGAEFHISVDGNNPDNPHSFTLRGGQTQDVTLGLGSFMVTESQLDSFVPQFSGDCTQTGGLEAEGTISAGQTLHCNITNEASSPPTSTCNPSTVFGQTATPTDGTCIAIFQNPLPLQIEDFFAARQRIRGTFTDNSDGSFTCTFSSTPPT